MSKWKKLGYTFVFSIFVLHLGMTSLYVVPSPSTPPALAALRNALYGSTLFRQSWPLFASYYPLKADLGLSVKCLSNAAKHAPHTYSDITTPVWQRRERGLLSPEQWIAQRLRNTLSVPYFNYARLKGAQGERTSYADFFNWLERTPTFGQQVAILSALAARHCSTKGEFSRADLQLWACPLELWRSEREPCTRHPLGTFALPKL